MIFESVLEIFNTSPNSLFVVHSSAWARVYGAAQATATTSTPCFKVWAGGSDPNIGDASIDGFVRVYGYKDS